MTSRRHGTGRVYQRRFDHEQAKARYLAGESIPELASAYGVTDHAVRFAVVPNARLHHDLYSKEWRTGVCEVCGGPAMRLVGSKRAHNRDGRCLCQRCRADVRRERLRFDAAGVLQAVRCSNRDCVNGERWQPPENFTSGPRHREVRPGGIHGHCRACQTAARRRYRDARKVPCETCGTPCLPASKKGSRGVARARCGACYRASDEFAANHAAAVRASAEKRRKSPREGESVQAVGSAEA